MARQGLAVLATALLAVVGFSACGEDEADSGNAIEAQEGNEVQLGAVTYRVVLFRELNPEATADAAIVEGVERGPDELLFGAFLQACNRGEEPVQPTGSIQLENAFGRAYQPLQDGVESTLAYAPRRLGPGECLPAPGSVADRSFDGAVVVFAAPEDITADRPLILELGEPGTGNEPARIRLDL